MTRDNDGNHHISKMAEDNQRWGLIAQFVNEHPNLTPEEMDALRWLSGVLRAGDYVPSDIDEALYVGARESAAIAKTHTILSETLEGLMRFGAGIVPRSGQARGINHRESDN